MLGNDVVDLGDPETRSGVRHPRFDARVFTREERVALAEASDPERLRWSLWAAKEAAYKCVAKRAPGTGFSPRLFEVRLESERSGSVSHGGRRLRVRLFRDGDALHAVASDAGDPERTARLALAELPADADPAAASQAVRALARYAAAALLGCPPGEIEIARQGRVPVLRRRGAPERLDLSLSHHGRFVAAALAARPEAGAS